MRVLIEITHPAHVHFFRNPIQLLEKAGHEIQITSRDKDCTLDLLDRYNLPHCCLSNQGDGIAMVAELASRNKALITRARKFQPDVMAGVGAICAAQVGRLLGIPSVVFYDTETARVQNVLTYSFATRVVVPNCYQTWVPKEKTSRYQGYHELSYLHPWYFEPDREKALALGLDEKRETFLVRLVSWQANHDVGLKGWSDAVLDAVVERLQARGKVIISAEGELPGHMQELRYEGDVSEIHHLLASCRACVGESATMSSEAVVLGVPSVYAAAESRGYVEHQADRYGMAVSIRSTQMNDVCLAIDEMLSVSPEEIQRRRSRLLGEADDVCRRVRDEITRAPMVT